MERPHRGKEQGLEDQRAEFLAVCSGLFILTDIPAAQGPSQRLKSQAFQEIQNFFFFFLRTSSPHLRKYSPDT